MSRRAGERTVMNGLISLAGAAGLVLLVPVVILLIGLPAALTVRALLEVIGWLIGLDVR